MKHNMKRASVADYLPSTLKAPEHLVQVRLPVELVNETKKYLRSNHMTWKDLMKACLENFRDTVIRK